jgi:hypothetical protein
MEEGKDWVRFQVLTGASMKVTVFWDVVPCSNFTDVSQVLTASINRAMDSVSTSETSVNEA